MQGRSIPRVLISEAAIRDRVRALAKRIDEAYPEGEELLLVGVLRGAFIFLADLSRAMERSHVIDFIAVSSYGMGSQSSGDVRLVLDLREPIAHKHVLIVEDIVDTGYTLRYLLDSFAARKPASLRTCALVRKAERHEVEIDVDFLGFDIPDVWVVGYGLDYADQHRSLPYIGELDPEDLEA